LEAGLPKIAACAEPCPDDRTGSSQYLENDTCYCHSRPVISNENEKSFLRLLLSPAQLQDLSHSFEMTRMVKLTKGSRNMSFSWNLYWA